MTKHRSVVTGWDPAKVNPDGSTGRPKGVQTAADMRIMTTFDVLAEGIFAAKGVPAITGSPTNTASISPFMAAIAAPTGGFYVVSIDAPENFTINMANVGAVKVYVQQEDYQVDNTKVDSNVVIGVVYGANPIPANSLLLFTTTITAQTSTNGLTFTPAFKYTGNLSGLVRVPTQADLANIATISTGMRALVTTSGGGGTIGEYFYTGSTWQITTAANPAIDGLVNGGWQPVAATWSFVSWNATTKIGVISVPSSALTRYAIDNFIRIVQATGGTKHGRILSLTATQLTVWLPDHTLVNEAITSPHYSALQSPNGIPITLQQGQIYKFQAYRSTAISVPPATKIPFDAKLWDPTNSFDTVNNRFVAPVTGYYDIRATIRMAASGSESYNQMEIMKNGSAIYQGGFAHFGPAGGSYNADSKVYMLLNAGDYVEIKFQGSPNGTLQGLSSGIYTSIFEGCLMSRG